MTIAALAKAGAVFRDPEWVDAAVRAFDFIVKTMGDGDRLYHSWRDGKRGYRALPTIMPIWRAQPSCCGR